MMSRVDRMEREKKCSLERELLCVWILSYPPTMLEKQPLFFSHQVDPFGEYSFIYSFERGVAVFCPVYFTQWRLRE